MWNKRAELDQEDLWKRYLLVNDWIKTADLKASFIAVASVGAVGFAIDLNKDLNPIETIFFLISLTSSLRSLWLSLKVNMPILKKYSPGPSLLYYGNIASLTNAKSLYDSLKSQNGSNKTEDLSNQIYENSKIAYKKMRLIGQAKWPLIVNCASLALLGTGLLDICSVIQCPSFPILK